MADEAGPGAFPLSEKLVGNVSRCQNATAALLIIIVQDQQILAFPLDIHLDTYQ